jgi:hypothetical protein
MEHELRRVIPRRVTDGRGKYMLVGDPEKRWRDCRVIDTSSAGAGLELFDASAEEIEGRHIILALQLKAEVRHTRLTPDKRLRVGVQFVELTDGEQMYLESLAQPGGRRQ